MKKKQGLNDMKITLRKPLGYSHIGRKERQEDAVWPLFDNATDKNFCFVLCDGVGGSKHGEIASRTSSKIIGEYLTQVLEKKEFVEDEDVQNAVSLAYDELENLICSDTEDISSMATTLTCVCIHKEGVLAAHIGDSRIYLIRPKQGLLYQSADHSLVNALIQAGELTIEEAQNFPKKNVITKAIQPNCKRVKAEVHQLTDIKAGDYLFLCCDGVLEQLSNERLVEILSMKISDKEKLSLLEQESLDKTKDNFTAYLIPIDKVTGISMIENIDEIDDVIVAAEQPIKTNNSLKKNYINLFKFDYRELFIRIKKYFRFMDGFSIQYKYRGEWYSFGIDNNEDIYHVIQNLPHSEKNINFPNDDIDIQIRDFVKKKVQEKPYYIAGVHPEPIQIIKNGEIIYIIQEFFTLKEIDQIKSTIIEETKQNEFTK